MARDKKIEVAAINIRIPDTHERDYTELLKLLESLKRGVRVYGDSYVAISFFDEKANAGIFSKYTEIDIDGAWFDLDFFGVASPDKIDEINIPDNLRPNLSQFYFKIDPDLHVVAFSTYSDSKQMSARSVQNYFSEALAWPEVVEKYGRVEADIVNDYDAVEKILNLPDLKELRIIIRRPNPDDVGRSLAAVIEERLREQNADEYQEILKARGSGSIDPNERTENLAIVAAENGEVAAKSIVNGVLVEQTTKESPLHEVKTFKQEEQEYPVFYALAKKIFSSIAAMRAKLADG